MVLKRAFATIAVVAAIALAYLFGAYSFALDLWPVREIRNAKRAAQGRGDVVIHFDTHGRLVDYPGKQEVACPAQDARTAVILVLGQSNTSNDAGQRYASAYGDRVVGYFDGRCSVAQSPLLGTTGMFGESWTLLANELVGAGLYDRIVLVPSGIGGTTLARWAAGGDVNALLAGVLDRLAAHYKVTQVIWGQGEDDFTAATTTSAYTAEFQSLVATLRAHAVAAPIFVSVATRCTSPDTDWYPDNPVARAQRALPDPARGVYAGVDTDRLMEPLDRYDDCHFSATGQEKLARAWLAVIRSER